MAWFTSLHSLLATFPTPVAPAPTDLWLNVVLGLAAIVTAVTLMAGAIFTARYGRRASVSVKADADKIPGGYILTVRPSVKAVGVFRIKFTKGAAGSQIRVAQVYVDEQWQPVRITGEPRQDIFGESFVEGGEELATTTVVPVSEPPGSVIGWFVWLQVCAPNRFLRVEWLRWIIDHRPVRWVVRPGFAKWVRTRTPAPIRRRVRRVLHGWQWTDQIFVPLPKGHG
jgi:hypothetical protein